MIMQLSEFEVYSWAETQLNSTCLMSNFQMTFPISSLQIFSFRVWQDWVVMWIRMPAKHRLNPKPIRSELLGVKLWRKVSNLLLNCVNREASECWNIDNILVSRFLLSDPVCYVLKGSPGDEASKKMNCNQAKEDEEKWISVMSTTVQKQMYKKKKNKKQRLD